MKAQQLLFKERLRGPMLVSGSSRDREVWLFLRTKKMKKLILELK